MTPQPEQGGVPVLAYEDDLVKLWHGDARRWLLGYAPQADAIVTDPPYGDTSLAWDHRVGGWEEVARHLAPQLWCFGSLRFHLAAGPLMTEAGWRLGQEIVWEKPYGSGMHADRFKRVHEIAVHWYHGKWESLRRQVPRTMVYGSLASNTSTPSNTSSVHQGDRLGMTHWSSDGERLMTSVIKCRSMHRRGAVHPTQKPLGILRPLIEFSCPPGGVVLDPFAGSGSTLLAARDLGRKAEGCEISREYVDAAIGRLSQGVLAA